MKGIWKRFLSQLDTCLLTWYLINTVSVIWTFDKPITTPSKLQVIKLIFILCLVFIIMLVTYYSQQTLSLSCIGTYYHQRIMDTYYKCQNKSITI